MVSQILLQLKLILKRLTTNGSRMNIQKFGILLGVQTKIASVERKSKGLHWCGGVASQSHEKMKYGQGGPVQVAYTVHVFKGLLDTKTLHSFM